ncbi:hypothetical protein L249_2545 [Ophiocordyceps polyrhachis-furcata BCC 54312]|uniref:Uncharacterized protein n=1 Tax=Ophiocordyceps polyrhachis-furcata BCC 54312 TaxID=1330021 RepID=A0A367LRC2_9HYPO|nr:hypothetical protein L249_2545 [Ophiocordyceps polyrhachis-furcata BCC 54312]
MLTRETDCIFEEGTPCLPPFLGSLTYPTFFFLRTARTARTAVAAVRRSRAVAASYVVMPFLPLLCDVRRPRAGCSRPGVTVSGAPAKLRYYKRIAIPYN